MKKINFRTFKFQIVLLFLVMSVPAMGLALAASYTITREAQEQIIDARQNNMKILVNQWAVFRRSPAGRSGMENTGMT